jgi:alkylhydroperoxidase family enzyme
VQKAWGFVLNLHRVLAESPAALEAYGALWGIAEKNSFTPVERNVAYLSIIYENECVYCMAGHTNLSRMAHVSDDAIAAVPEGRPIVDARLEALRRFAALVTRNRGVVSQAEIEAFKAAGYSNQAILDVLVLAATKLISNYTNHLAQTPLIPS